ncbi:AAA-like domain-containing protein [Leptolyngbya sp. FACHB-261]|uniref:AAA-like domain-containing protein n=1 Tax=Leptolyngbya sp. FACHB-261 TaxID=2692806 RepID=UPI001F5576AD|nr:AAA-like domain-containing protein [Leptolyngbya sp. FACHB-261]
MATGERAQIFISYRRSEPDQSVALAVYQALGQDHEVFIDQTMTVGTRWAERIEAEIQRSDYLITFISAQSVTSEMVVAEIEKAHHLSKQTGKPGILPVRLAYTEPLVYPLSAYLNSINWAFWKDEQDTPRLIAELQRAIAGAGLAVGELNSRAAQLPEGEPPEGQPPEGQPDLARPLPSAQPVSLELPEGTMDPESAFYVARPSADPLALETIAQQGVTITIKGPRQMGKSSLLIRTIGAAVEAGKRVAFLDFQLFDQAALADAGLFFRRFSTWLTRKLRLTNRIEEYWASGLGHSQCCTDYLECYLLEELASPLVLAMDEVESVLDTDFHTDFFGMLRSWHNNRAITPIWKRLDLVLVTSTEPYQLIENLNQSPFNVGQVIELEDFTLAQVADLNLRHGQPLNLEQERQLMTLLGGHPYLVRRALYLVASQQITVADLFTNATADRGPLGDHLSYHLFRLHERRELVQGLLQVIRNQTCPDERVFFRLRGAGLVRRQNQRTVPRCQLYAEYFREHLRG